MARAARPWFRFYVEAVHDRKLRRLKPELRWLFVACLAAARQSPEPGTLLVGEDDPMDAEDVADFAGMPVKVVELGMEALSSVGIVAFDQDDGCWYVPNWHERQFESDNVTKRTAKHRSKEPDRNVPTSFEGTPPETEAESDTESSSSTKANEDDDPMFVEAQRRCSVMVRAGRRIDDPIAYTVRIYENLRAEGWRPSPSDFELADCTNPDCDHGWIRTLDGEVACVNCYPWMAPA